MSTNNVDNFRQNLGQSVGTIELIDVLNVLKTLFLGLGIADIIDVKAQRLRQIVKAMQAQLIIQIGNLKCLARIYSASATV
jgi:hypothetical protein